MTVSIIAPTYVPADIISTNNNINNISAFNENNVRVNTVVEKQNSLREQSEKISDTLKNVQLPLRNKPTENEPFEKLLNMNYMTYFLAVSSIVIFCIGLFN